MKWEIINITQFRLDLTLLLIHICSESWTVPRIPEAKVVLILLADRMLQGKLLVSNKKGAFGSIPVPFGVICEPE